MITITFAWWWIPTLITVVAICWALFVVDGGGGWFSGLDNIFALIPSLFISMISWIIAACFK